MDLFEPVVDKKIYYLRMPYDDAGAGMVLVTDEGGNTLIDCGSDASAVDNILAPALKKHNMSIKSLTRVTVTHAHPENIGGLHRICALNPDITVVAPDKCRDMILNPMRYVLETRRAHPEHNPPLKEVRGVFVGERVSEGHALGELTLIGASGHDDANYCWYHAATKTLISGDTLQGNGNRIQGMAYYTSFADYRRTLRKLMNMDIENIVCSHDMDGVGCIVRGAEACKLALQRCWDCTEDYDRRVRELKRNEKADVPTIVEKISQAYFKCAPEYPCYAMFTVNEHYKRG